MEIKKPKLIIVDDEEAIRECLQYHFEQKGYCVFAAGSAEEALPVIKKESPDTMLLDITLPGMSGIELLKLVREFNQSIKVIVVSGTKLDFGSQAQLKRLNIFADFEKPADIHELEAAIKKSTAEERG